MTEGARDRLATLLMDGALVNAQKSNTFGGEATAAEGDFQSIASSHHAKAALCLTQAWMTLTKVEQRR